MIESFGEMRATSEVFGRIGGDLYEQAVKCSARAEFGETGSTMNRKLTAIVAARLLVEEQHISST
jgi:hypothetical protein